MGMNDTLTSNQLGIHQNESSNATSYGQEELFEYVTEGWLLTCISILGFIGNTMAIYVLLRPPFRGIFSHILTSLATFDALFLTTLPFTFGFPILSSYYKNHLYAPIIPIAFGLTHTFRLGSVLATLSVTIERFFAIVLPLKDLLFLSRRLIPGTVLIAVFYNLPTFFEITTVKDPATNATIIAGTNLRKNKLYFAIHKVYAKIAIDLFAYIVIIVLNTWIFIKMAQSASLSRIPKGLRASIRQGKRSVVTSNEDGRKYSTVALNHNSTYLDVPGRSSSVSPRRVSKDFDQDRNQENKLGTLLLSISLLFIFCQSFKMIPDIYELIFCPPSQSEDQPVCETTPFVDTCVSLSHLFVCGNSALNWIVYLLAGEKFRSAWCNTYLPRQCVTSRLQRTNARYPRFQSPTKSPTTNGMETRISRMSFNENIEMYTPRKSLKTFTPRRNNSLPSMEMNRESNIVSSTMDHALKNENEGEQTTTDCYLTVTITVTQC